MTIQKAFALGLTGNELSKKIVGSDEVSVGRTVVATSTGAICGAATAGAIVVAGLATAPITVSLATGSAIVAGIASLFDD